MESTAVGRVGVTEQASAKPADRFIREGECRQLTGLSRSQRWRLEREGRFPARVQLSERAFAWLESELRTWISDRIRERDNCRRMAA